MLNASSLPDLTFPMVKLGRRETPWSLKPLLYRGGAGTNAGQIATLIGEGKLGPPQFQRLSLVQALHGAITDKLVGGGSKETQKNNIGSLRAFFTWAEKANHPLALDTVTSTFLHWTDALLYRVRVIKDIAEVSAYTEALRVSNILDSVLL